MLGHAGRDEPAQTRRAPAAGTLRLDLIAQKSDEVAGFDFVERVVDRHARSSISRKPPCSNALSSITSDRRRSSSAHNAMFLSGWSASQRSTIRYSLIVRSRPTATSPT